MAMSIRTTGALAIGPAAVSTGRGSGRFSGRERTSRMVSGASVIVYLDCHTGSPVSYLLAFLGFAALIILHEFGHFAAAKAVGMRVERFSLFFGPLLVRLRRGETEYALGSIPLGGYVKIT